jgi:ectoine hydroxylase-related dioxygenase (phytanoyl-CoA dioxygenase family)
MSNAPKFKTFPTQDQLAHMDRDLTFHPSTVQNPKILKPAQIAHYNRQGYINNVRVFSAEEIAGTRAFVDALISRVMAQGGSSYSVKHAHMKYGTVWDLITHPRITAIVKDVLGDEVVGWGAHFFCKMPGDGKIVAWHQDASYWPLTPSKTLTVWLAVDNADVENGCMKFVAGSHLQGQVTFRPSTAGEDNVLDQTVENAERYGTVVYDELQAGEISIHSDLLLHSSEANNSQRRRCGLTLRYCTPDVRGTLGWNNEGILISGADPEGHWGNPPRPVRDYEGI